MAKSLSEMSPQEQVEGLQPRIEKQRLQGSTRIPLPWWVSYDAMSILKKVFPGTHVAYVYNITYLVFPERSQ